LQLSRAPAAPHIQDWHHNQRNQYHSYNKGLGNENALRIHQDELAVSGVKAGK
jgi:hypothetical protein